MKELQSNDHTLPQLTEALFTIPQAAKRLGLPVYAVRRAAKAGLIPTHRPFSSRVRVLLSEVRVAIAAQDGGVEL